jgi:hypothetical protein
MPHLSDRQKHANCSSCAASFSFPRARVALDLVVPDAFGPFASHLALTTTNCSLITWSRVALEGVLEVGLCNRGSDII